MVFSCSCCCCSFVLVCFAVDVVVVVVVIVVVAAVPALFLFCYFFLSSDIAFSLLHFFLTYRIFQNSRNDIELLLSFQDRQKVVVIDKETRNNVDHLNGMSNPLISRSCFQSEKSQQCIAEKIF